MLKRFMVLSLVSAAWLASVGCSTRQPGKYVISGPKTGSASTQRTMTLPSASLKPPVIAPSSSVLPPATVAAPVKPIVAKPATATTPIPAPVTAPARPAAGVPPPAVPADLNTAKMASAYTLKPGDYIYVYLRGIPQEQQIEDQIDELGYITLPYINEVLAAGRTGSELERIVRSAYIDQQIYKNISVNVVLPSKFYYVRGEVKQPGRYPIMANVTILQAIATAGGYTEFANARKVQLLRGDKSEYINAKDLERNPQRDVAVESGDVIVVHRSAF